MKPAAPGLACLLWLCAAPAVAAGAVLQLGDAIPGHPGLTYYDLAKRLVTDLGPPRKEAELVVAEGQKVIPFTHIEGKDRTGAPPQDISLNFSDVDAMNLPGDESRLLFLVDLGPEEEAVGHAELLGLFSLVPALKLLDVVEVGSAESTGFAQKSKPPMLAKRTPLLLIDSEHDNADESTTSTEMIFIRDNRFQFIGSFTTFDEKQCAYRRMETPSYGILPGGGPFPAIRVAVEERVTPTGEQGCGSGQASPKARVSTYAATYRWDARARRYASQSTEMKRLEEDNGRYP
jgi:hypothetical protein